VSLQGYWSTLTVSDLWQNKAKTTTDGGKRLNILFESVKKVKGKGGIMLLKLKRWKENFFWSQNFEGKNFLAKLKIELHFVFQTFHYREDFENCQNTVFKLRFDK